MRVKFILLMGAFAIGISGSSFAQTSTSLLKEAITLTAERKFPEAEARYRQLAETDPLTGYPALARFLSRTGRTTAVVELLNSPEIQRLSPLYKARTAVAAQMTSEAISFMQAPAAAGEEYQQAILLANQLQQIGAKEQAADVLSQAVGQANHTPVERKDLFQKLMRLKTQKKLQAALPLVLDALVSTRALTYPQLREMTNDAMMILSQHDDYAEFQRELEQNRNASPARGWLYALAAIKRGEPEKAREQLETLTSASLSPAERLVIDEELARTVGDDPERQVRIYEDLLPHAIDHHRIRVTLSQMLYRQRRYEKIAQLLKDVDPTQLDDSQLQVYKNVKLAISSINRPENTIAEFEREVKGLGYERLREVAQAPLVNLQPKDLQTLRQTLLSRLESPTAPAELYVLLMAVEHKLGNEEGVTQALQRYVERNPQNLEAASELADALAQRAYVIATSDPTTSPSAEVLQEAANSAAEGLWHLIEMRPYVPEPYEKLIAIYKLYGQPEKARQVTSYLTDSTTATAEEIHLAAYIMATNGMPEDAIPVYERALKLRPDRTLFRLNYAGALSRVGRLKEADAIYRDVIENGVNGRQYHAHEVYANGILLARNNGYLEEFLAFLRGLIPKSDMPQHDYFLIEVSKVLTALNLEREALHYLEAVQVQYPEKAWEAREHKVTAYVSLKDFEKAEKVLMEAEQESTDTVGLVLARNNRAVVRAESGKLDEAVELWKALAEEFPRDRTAARGLLIASQRLVEAGRFRQANELLRRYLSLDTGDADGEVSARELLARVKSLDVPSSTLVRSAIEEASAPQTQ